MLSATILLPNYNNARVLPLTFERLRRNVDCKSVHFVMVDDGSEDDGVKVAKAEVPRCGFASVEIIERKHEGIVPTLNAGLAAVSTELVVRIDGDATVETPGWLLKLASWLESREVGMVGGQVIWETGRVHSFGRSVVSELGLFDVGCVPLEPIGRRTFDSIVYCPKSEFAGGMPYEVDTILGVCVAFRRSDAMAVGGFDMTFNPVWIEDDDFGLALRKLGKRMVIDPSVHVVHRPSLRGSREPGREGSEVRGPRRKRSVSDYVTGAMRRVVRASMTLVDKPVVIRHPTLEELIPTEGNAWRSNILKGHYQAWEKKWGFNPINPDMPAVFDRYWDSPLCWRSNPRLRQESATFLRKAAI